MTSAPASGAPARRPPTPRLQGLPALAFARDPGRHVPDRCECAALWDQYGMPAHIRAHSELVADFAAAMAGILCERGADVHVPSVLAAGLLHDLGKMYSIEHGGSHAQLGAAWAMNATGNPHIAQGVILHVDWPWEIHADDDRQLLPLCVIYADKRVKHTALVSLAERYEDLFDRYGVSPAAVRRIEAAREQAYETEAALSRRMGIMLDEYTLDSGRLVQRT